MWWCLSLSSQTRRVCNLSAFPSAYLQSSHCQTVIDYGEVEEEAEGRSSCTTWSPARWPGPAWASQVNTSSKEHQLGHGGHHSHTKYCTWSLWQSQTAFPLSSDNIQYDVFGCPNHQKDKYHLQKSDNDPWATPLHRDGQTSDKICAKSSIPLQLIRFRGKLNSTWCTKLSSGGSRGQVSVSGRVEHLSRLHCLTGSSQVFNI